MSGIVYAILVLSGAVLGGAGAIADALRPNTGAGSACSAWGTILVVVGLIGCVLKPWWDAIPVSKRKQATEASPSGKEGDAT